MMRDDMMDAASSSDSDESLTHTTERVLERTSSSSSSAKFSLSALVSGDGFGLHSGSGPSKRRGGMTFGGSSRDAKSRRREDSFGVGHGRRGGPSLQWDQRDQGTTLKPKDELVDTQLVESLRAQFGDPFDDRIFQSHK